MKLRTTTMRRTSSLGAGALAGAAFLTACAMFQEKDEKSDTMEVSLCDGETVITTQGNPGQSRAEGQRIADELMAAWLAKNPMEQWEIDERERHDLLPASDNRDVVLSGGQAEGATYGFTQRDVLLWKREAEKLAVEGSRIFHSAQELGSAIAVSCDMCHPDAANTHPETYPKFQAQRGQVSLLRDMINWCIENPVRGTKLEADDPRMRAMEAYIMAMGKGRVMEYGKH